MIIKINSEPNKVHYPELEIISEKIDEPIFIQDDYEAQGYYPLFASEEDRLFEFIHNAAHPDNDITFSNIDMNLQANYEKWCDITNQKRRLKILDRSDFLIKNYVRTCQTRWADYNNPGYEKGYKICTLVNIPKIYRLLTLGRLSGKLGFIYSYKATPTHFLGDDSAINDYFKQLREDWGENKYWKWYEGNNIKWGNVVYPIDYPAPCDLSYGEFKARKKVILTEECPERAKGTSCEHDIFSPKEWWMSYIDLVQENKVCIANTLQDKTCKPLYWGKMFLTIGGPGWYKRFQRLGFKLYDELFDYSFDDNPSFEYRWKHIMNQCDDILENMSMEELEDKEKFLKPKIDYNARRIREINNV